MLISSHFPRALVGASSTASYETSTNYSHPTISSTLASPTPLPKHYNVPFAIQRGYFRSVRYLLELDYDPNERDSQLRTPLILCAYVESDRWSASLAQNLLEKGAKIALEDHARRNAMHHACAVQRLELVEMYLSCLDFNIEAQDCEGNTCLHYAAITGNCDVAELLMRSAERIGIRLDRFVNREGCSAAVLALKYGHIECANQISHRDTDEFIVVPRPLSIYENPSTVCDNPSITISMTKPRSKSKARSSHSAALPFGLLKIIFNDSDTGYSTRLASLCEREKRSQRSKHPKQEARQRPTTTINNIDRTKSTTVNGTRYCSTQVLVNDSHILPRSTKHSTGYDSSDNLHSSGRLSPRIDLLTQQQQQQQQHRLSTSITTEHDSTLSKTRLSINDISMVKSNGSKTERDEHLHRPNGILITQQPSNTPVSRATGSMHHRPKTSVHINPLPPQLNSTNLKRAQLTSASPKRKLTMNDRASSSSTATKHTRSTRTSEPAAEAAPLTTTRSSSKSIDLAYPIREATGPTSRYNKPEELFGLRPEELFCAQPHQPIIFDSRSIKRSYLSTQQHNWHQDVDKMLDLYNVHNSSTYRKAAVPPQTSLSSLLTTETVIEAPPPAPKVRQTSATKHHPTTTSTSAKSSSHSKHTTVTSSQASRRNSVHRPSVKSIHA